MNFLEIIKIVMVTIAVISPASFLMAALMLAVGVQNKEEEAYRRGFKNGSKSVEKLKEIGCCHDYQNERKDLVQWIDKVNEVIKGLW